MARKALGRGLDALLPGGRPEGDGGTALVEVDIDQIRPNPRQPRERFDADALKDIADSLQECGMLQPVVLRKVAAGYELIAGERRWRAAQQAGWARIPAVVREATPEQALQLALIENIQRQDLNPIEEARAYRMLLEELDVTQEELAGRVGRDRSTVANYLRLLNLDDKVQEMMVAGDLAMGHARALLALDKPADQRRLAEEVASKGLSVRQTESRVAAAKRDGGRRPSSKKKDPDVAAAEDRLAKALGTSVTIRGKERGRIEIRYTSLEELERLYELLLGR